MGNKDVINIWMLDDNMDSYLALKNSINSYRVIIKWFPISQQVKEELNKFSPPDLLLLDLCLFDGEENIVSKQNNSYEDLGKLVHISGIKFLTYLRCYWPRLPVILISQWVNQYDIIQQLSQHALAFINIRSRFISELLEFAHKVIIGIRINRLFGRDSGKFTLKEKFEIEDGAVNILISKINNNTERILKNLNELQNHFFFVLINDESDLTIPPVIVRGKDEKDIQIEIIEVWNNRILGIIDDVSFCDYEETDGLYPGLPFSRNQLYYHPVRLFEYINLMGIEYWKPYLLRECTKIAYSIFFNIKEHPMDTGKCLFDSSNNPAHLLKGIEQGSICNECKSQMIPDSAFGGWSEGRTLAATEISKAAKEALVKTRINESVY